MESLAAAIGATHATHQRIRDLVQASLSDGNAPVSQEQAAVLSECLAVVSNLEERIVNTLALQEGPKELLGIKDIRAIHAVMDYVVLTGVYPHLQPGVGLPLAHRTKSDIAQLVVSSSAAPDPTVSMQGLNDTLQHLLHIVTDTRPRHGYQCLQSMLFTRYLLDLYASLCQLIHMTFQQPEVASTLAIQPASLLKELGTLIQRADPFRSLNSLTVLLQPHGTTVPPPWFRRLCSQYLSKVVLRPGGVEVFIEFMLDTQGELTTGRLESIARLILSVPRRYIASPDQYYRQVGIQLWELFQIAIAARIPNGQSNTEHGATDHSVRFAGAVTFILTKMIQKDPKLTRELVIDPLISPLKLFYPKSDATTLPDSREATLLHTTPSLPSTTATSKVLLTAITGLHLLLLSHDLAPSVFQLALVPVVECVYFYHDYCLSLGLPSDQPALDMLLTFFRVGEPAVRLRVLKRIAFMNPQAYFTRGSTGMPEMRLKQDCQARTEDATRSSLLSSYLQTSVDTDRFVTFLKDLHDPALVGDFFILLLKEYALTADGSSAHSVDQLSRSLTVMSLVSVLADKMGPVILKRPSQVIEFANGVIEQWCTTHLQSNTKPMTWPSPTKGTSALLEPTGQSILNIASLQVNDSPNASVLPTVTANPSVFGGSEQPTAGFERTAAMEPLDANELLNESGEELSLVLQLLAAILYENKALDERDLQQLSVTNHYLRLLAASPYSALRDPAAELAIKINARQAQRDSASSSTGPAHQSETQRRAYEASRDKYQQAMDALEDDILPIRAHGLAILRDMALAQDPFLTDSSGTDGSETTARLDQVFDLFLQMVQQEDSYLYLNGVKCLSALTDVQGLRFIPKLTAVYSAIQAPEQQRSLSAPPATVDFRLRVGEALLQTVQRAGQALGRYAHLLLPCLLAVLLNEPNTHLRTSAVSILSAMAEASVYTLHPWLRQIVDWMIQVLTYDQEAELRRAATVLLISLLRGHYDEFFQHVPADTAREIYRVLKRVRGTDSDLMTRQHAQVGLSELDNVLRDFFNIEQPKHILLLD
ncbi:hypothetical protein H4R34_000242 [Dimargaris verticillata]|uniref:RNA polymerase II assembly factor Rtp1 C-terminal domain-containing protein n=1 Tax=Dimargaris verticillata TaxID=2761393 RepID=A0A9W8EG35_9FUNG|nr:hypothetical protein H4R34_000242 [Dimargaris verticillata]